MKVTDRRHGRTPSERPGTGLVQIAHGSSDVTRAVAEERASRALALGRTGSVPTDQSQVWNGTLQRLRRQGATDVNFSMQKPRDLDYWWERNNDFYDVESDNGLKALRNICTRLYSSHPLIGSAVDIFSKWPVVGAEFRCKDEKLVEFYSDLFFDNLNYEDYLVDIGREYWTVGEALPLGTWNETLGVWASDELVPPDDVQVRKSPFQREPALAMRLPADIRRLLRDQQPRHEYEALVRNYPDLVSFAYTDQLVPVSGHLLKHIKFAGRTFHDRGIPIMSRGLRAVLQEEMLNAAQDAISDRLATPLILARIGASASDLGTTQPWIPDQTQIAQFEGMLDAALAADFRMLTTHFAVQIDSVFGRETMPNFDNDFERLTERILQVWGMSKTMLSGAGSGQTYAADAMNRDLISQLASTFQRSLKRFVRDRMLVVAEAQGHYDYETRGNRRYPIMEEVLVVDENGNQRVEERPRLLVPDLHLKAMTMADEKVEQEFFDYMAASGVPISRRTRFANKPINYEDEVEQVRQEKVNEAIAAQETRKATYNALVARGLPIPEDLKADFEPRVRGPQEGSQGVAAPLTEGDPAPPMLGDPQPMPVLMEPAAAEYAATAPGGPLDEGSQGQQAAGVPGQATRPPESDEQRAGMPRRVAIRDLPPTQAPIMVKVATAAHETLQEIEVSPGGIVLGPSHIGKRLALTADTPLED